MTTDINEIESTENNSGFHPFDYPEIKQLFGDLLGSLLNESGRGAILIATAHVDSYLTKLIEAVIPKDFSKSHKDKLFKYPGHLSSLASKIELAYVFRLINKNLYDSLNALRKIRNDAAHSHLKFELHELNEQLKSVYEFGDGFPNFVRQISGKAVVQFNLDKAKNALNEIDLSEDEKQEIIQRVFNDEDKMDDMKKQVPFWELVYGLTFLCAILTRKRESIVTLTKDINTFSDLLKK